MPVVCTPQDLMAAAKCFECYTTQQHMAVQTYALVVIAGESLDPAVLIKKAACLTCLTTQQREAIRILLECTIANL